MIDCGNERFASEDDYTDFGIAVGRAVSGDKKSCGIAVCGSGVGVCVSANKVGSIRAVLADTKETAGSAREDDDANVLCLGARHITPEIAQEIVTEFLATSFRAEERFKRRIRKLGYIERAQAICQLKKTPIRQIVPAVLESDARVAREKLEAIEGSVSWVQIDIADASFVPAKTFDVEMLNTRKFPFFFEAHLMVASPDTYIETCARLGYRRVTWHFEAVRNVEKARILCQHIAERGMEVGVAVGPDTDISFVRELSEYIDAVLILGVRPGKSGQKMLVETVDRLQHAYNALPRRVSVEVDGGVTLENVKACFDAGAKRVAVGSAIFGSNDPAEAVRELARTIIE